MTAQPVDYSTPDPGDPLALEQDFTELAHAIKRLSEDCPARLEQDDTPESAVELLNDLRTFRKALQEVEAFVEAKTVARLPYGKTRFGDLLAEVKGGARSRTDWRHDELAWALVADLCQVEGTIDDAAAALVGMVRDRIVNCAGIGYWRTAQVKQLGVDPDKFCGWKEGRQTVALTPYTDEVES